MDKYYTSNCGFDNRVYVMKRDDADYTKSRFIAVFYIGKNLLTKEQAENTANKMVKRLNDKQNG